jgi:vacuolar protein sorting-associated protein 26
VGVIENLYDKN